MAGALDAVSVLSLTFSLLGAVLVLALGLDVLKNRSPALLGLAVLYAALVLFAVRVYLLAMPHDGAHAFAAGVGIVAALALPLGVEGVLRAAKSTEGAT